jgi:hypothetical protein
MRITMFERRCCSCYESHRLNLSVYHLPISFRIEDGELAQNRDCQAETRITSGICTRYIALAFPALAYFSETWGRVVQNAANLKFRRL